MERYTTSSLSGALILVLIAAAGPAWGDKEQLLKSTKVTEEKPKVEVQGERREAFEEAMKQIAAAERKRAEEQSLKEWRKTVAEKSRKKLRDFVEQESGELAREAVRKTNTSRNAARDFADAATGKIPSDVEDNFKSLLQGSDQQLPLLDPSPESVEQKPALSNEHSDPVAVSPAANPAKLLPPPPTSSNAKNLVILPPPPSPSEPVVPRVTPAAERSNSRGFSGTDSSGQSQQDNRTVIDADGSVIFDGSGRFGEEYQAVIFEDNVVVTNPEFTMTSDYLTAFFSKSKDSGSENESADQSSRLDRAVATGEEVVVRKTIADGELQVAKSRKATFIASDPNRKGTVDEVVLEVWPRVQRGNNLIVAKSKDTVIILRRDEMIVNGPVRTEIVGGGGLMPESESGKQEDKEKDSEEGTATSKTTVIDAARGAIFNRLDPVTRNREMFFEGDVKIADTQFDISCETLTAYMRFTEGEKGLQKAVANGLPEKRVRVERHTENGERQLGLAQEVTYVISSGDVVLDIWPEIRRGSHSSVAKHRDARIVMKKNGNVESRGVDIQIVPDGDDGLKGLKQEG